MKNNTEKIEILREWSIEQNVKDISSHILNNPMFAYWSGSSKPEQHHYGDFGLCEHTFEVVSTSLKIADQYRYKITFNRPVLFLAALYHDYGKLWDYHRNFNHESGKYEYSSNEHKRTIHHISRSAIEFNKICGNYNFADDVTHCILSHHGRREFGSPVAPYTAEAWVLHLADSISARMDDVYKIDLVSHKP